MIVLAFCLAYAGLCSLCLAMPAHFKELIGREARAHERLGMRALGWSAQGLALSACFIARGAAVGTILYLGIVTVAALALVLMLPYRPRWPLYIASIGTALGLFLLPFSH
jgi:hypothetical protein